MQHEGIGLWSLSNITESGLQYTHTQIHVYVITIGIASFSFTATLFGSHSLLVPGYQHTNNNNNNNNYRSKKELRIQIFVND